MKKSGKARVARGGRVIQVALDPRSLRALADAVCLLATREKTTVVHLTEPRCPLCGERVGGPDTCSWSQSSGHSEGRADTVSKAVSFTAAEIEAEVGRRRCLRSDTKRHQRGE